MEVNGGASLFCLLRKKETAPSEWKGPSGWANHPGVVINAIILKVSKFVNMPRCSMSRVTAYIDGFNLYFGLRAKGWRQYYWLNVQLLALNLLKPDQRLLFTKYFTSRIKDPPDKQRRQSTFIEALETLNDFRIFMANTN